MNSSSHITLSGGLFTHHFIEAVQQAQFSHPAAAADTFALPGQDSPSQQALEQEIASAWELLVERWDSVEDELPQMDISTLRRRWLLPLFSLVDFDLDYQRADLEIDDVRFPVSHLGRASGDISQYIAPVHTLLPDGPAGLDTRPASRRRGPKGLAPHDMLQRYLNFSPDYLWGLISNGLHLRVLRDYYHSSSRGYVEFHLGDIFATRDFAAFRALYRMAHASRFLALTPGPSPEGRGELPLEQFYQYALSTGVKVGEDLRQNVQNAIETLANGFIRATPTLLDRLQTEDEQLYYTDFGQMSMEAAFFHDVLTTIYRVLFLLFAEQRGMLPGRGSLYMDEFSMTALRARAERPVGEDQHVDLWERLKTAFEMVGRGVPALGVFGYNGALFSPERTPLLMPNPETLQVSETPKELQAQCHNDSLLRAIRYLTTVETEGTLQRVSYADLSVEEIGSIYESLLDFTPRVSRGAETVEGRDIPPGTFYLDPRGSERKTTGSYYTHPSLVDQLIQSALIPVMEERIREVVPAYDPDAPENLTPSQRAAAAEAILSLKVCDPAAGSGAFLIAADNTLALHLARIRGGNLYPREDKIRHARRDVLANCIFGVDLNPMAVELCKVSLWINAAVDDQPLNFLDHHIKCGNSLIGATPDLLSDGIPYKAFALGRPGDDRDLAKHFRAKNREERRHFEKHQTFQPQLGLFVLRSEEDLQRYLALIDLAAENPHQAREQYGAYIAGDEYRRAKLEADFWTAAFFWPLPEGTGWAPTFGEFKRLQTEGPEAIPAEKLARVSTLADKHRFFHWQIEFPEVFQTSEVSETSEVSKGSPEVSSGFDVILGNPPWERIKLQEKEFFADKDQKIAEASTAAKRRKLIKRLPDKDSELWEQYQDALRASECTSEFLRESGRFPLSAVGDINTYQVFAGLARQIVAGKGRAGIIVPTGIATDYYNQDYFSAIIENRELVSLYDFENRKGIFPGVHRSYKFSLLTLSGEMEPVIEPEFAFFLHQIDQLQDEQRRFHLSAEDLRRINPNTRTCPVFRNRRDAELTRKLYRAAPVLINEALDKNPWGISFTTMFHMANDSHLFRTRNEMESQGFELKGNVFVREDEVWLPLYEAKMFWHFDHRFGTFSGVDNRSDIHLPNTQKFEHRDPRYLVLPWYWVSVNEFLSRRTNLKSWFISFRNITNSTNERTTILSVIPPICVGHSAPLILSRIEPALKTLLLTNFITFVFDFVVRQKLGGTNFTYYYWKQLPVFTPSRYSLNMILFIAPRFLELTYTAWDLKAFADDVWMDAGRETDDGKLREAIERQWQENAAETGGGHAGAEPPEWVNYLVPEEPEEPKDAFPHPPFMWDEERRFRLRAELDALYAHLYGLHRDELAYILETFPIVKRKDEEQYGEFRTKRAILAYFDELADSDFDFPDKGPNVLAEDYVPLEEPEEPKEAEVAEGKASDQVEPADRRGSAEPDADSAEDVQLTPAHGFEFYLAVQEELGDDVSIADIYAATLANPEVKTVEGLVRVMRE